jgi:hypothetical protein
MTTPEQPAFVFGAVPESPERPGEHPLIEKEVLLPPPLGPLENFTGTFIGKGFNTIFRPQNPATHAKLPTPVPDSDNVLELNLTEETLTFGAKVVGSSGGVVKSLGTVPNRGEVQRDISLNGVPYLQTINDVTDPHKPVGIHFEPGLWMIVPKTTDPKLGQTLTRMASIPHGTTINAQGTAFPPISGPPNIKPVNTAGGPTPNGITPFKTGQPSNLIRFASQTAATPKTARIPQDLTSFIAAGAITQDLLDNPNLLLRNHIAHQNVVSTTTIVVATNPASPLFGGGSDNIAFLLGDPAALTNPDAAGPNAQALSMQATFWIETVEIKIVVPPFTPGHPPLIIPAEPAQPGFPAPRFQVAPPVAITQPRTITVRFTQIQYSQTVLLNFNDLTWPHVSVATLVPLEPIVVPPSAFN